MRIRQGFEEKSRLGRLLINRGYLSEGQLDEGLRLQRETGQRLGEVFIQAGWISEKELYRVLKHQSRYRNAAALVTMVTLPFQPLVTFAASNSAEASQSALEAGELYERGNLAPLSESELATISGQGIDAAGAYRRCQQYGGESDWRRIGGCHRGPEAYRQHLRTGSELY